MNVISPRASAFFGSGDLTIRAGGDLISGNLRGEISKKIACAPAQYRYFAPLIHIGLDKAQAWA
jgi:hypothetical protein